MESLSVIYKANKTQKFFKNLFFYNIVSEFRQFQLDILKLKVEEC